MRIGILADIHEDVEALTEALSLLRAQGAEQLVVLGDILFTGQHAAETTDRLARAGVIGVWGNHDIGLCHQPEPHVLARYPESVVAYLQTLRPRLELEDCLFSHGLPQWDATDPGIYYLGGEPEGSQEQAGAFAASTCRVSFLGHFHRWMAATPQGGLPWKGERPMILDPTQRYLVVIAPVFEGWCAVYDTTDGRLVPHCLDLAGQPRDRR